jgi:hypothetical protein
LLATCSDGQQYYSFPLLNLAWFLIAYNWLIYVVVLTFYLSIRLLTQHAKEWFKLITINISFVTEHYLKYQNFKTHVFWKMTPCRLVKMYGLFGGPCSLYLPPAVQKIVSGILKIQVRRRKPPVKRLKLFTWRHCVICRKTWMFTILAVASPIS